MKTNLKISISIFIALILSLCFVTNAYATQSYSDSYRTLKIGSRGADVSRLQQTLNNKNYSAGYVDGIYGNMTKKAIISFQRNNNLIVDGIAGKQTQTSLYATNASRSYSNSYSLLKVGSKGTSVSKLQQTLNNKGYYVGYVDGIYGNMTKKAIIKFQKDNKLIVDGIAGNETQSVLYSLNNTPAVASRGISSASRAYTSTDLYWLSRIIHAESNGEPYNGKISVGNVILNRVDSNLFPNTIKGVIFEYFQNIPQFSPVADGSIYNTPSDESIQAAKDSLNGTRPVGTSTYFFNPDKASGRWIVENKTYVMRIGDHVFYK